MNVLNDSRFVLALLMIILGATPLYAQMRPAEGTGHDADAVVGVGIMIDGAAERVMTDLFGIERWLDEYQLMMTVDGPVYDDPLTYIERGEFQGQEFWLQAYVVASDIKIPGKIVRPDQVGQADLWIGKLWTGADEIPAAGVLFHTESGVALWVGATWFEYQEGLHYLDNVVLAYRMMVEAVPYCDCHDAGYDICVQRVLTDAKPCLDDILTTFAVDSLKAEAAFAFTCFGCMGTFNPILCTACLGSMGYWGTVTGTFIKDLRAYFRELERALTQCCHNACAREEGVPSVPVTFNCPAD